MAETDKTRLLQRFLTKHSHVTAEEWASLRRDGVVHEYTEGALDALDVHGLLSERREKHPQRKTAEKLTTQRTVQELRSDFVALFNACRQTPAGGRRSMNDALTVFLSTLDALKPGVDRLRVFGVLRAAHRCQRAADDARPYVNLREQRAKIARLEGRLKRDIRKLIALHDRFNPSESLVEHAVDFFPTAETYETLLDCLDRDIVFQEAAACGPIGKPARIWIQQARRSLRETGMTLEMANDLLRQLGI